ncbi:MAG: iron ABC transporter permease [Pseudomonadota bacterium]
MTSIASKISLQKRRQIILILAIFLVLLLAGFSLKFGYQQLSIDQILSAISNYNAANAQHVLFAEIRVPRLIAACLAGVSLGLAGTLMQVLTRNPLADPGLLGVNAGASMGVVISIMLLGMTDPAQYVWTALIFALFVSIVVFSIGANQTVSPARLIIAGAAIMALCIAIIQALLLVSRQTLDTYRFWVLGGFDGIQLETIFVLSPLFFAGAFLAAVCSFWLNALILGTDTAKGLGLRVTFVQLATGLSVVLLCAATVAMAGPISFVGLLSAHIARLYSGSDVRWTLILSSLIGIIVLTAADLLGRTAFFGGNMQAGVMSAIIGGPVLIWIIKRRGLVRN